ncbi:TonB-dependent receptor plug domain-containing protein [Niveispirillum sp. SYP-B3756]|nr:TonB-dependent receptor plug domain-containing protein [Niveispirillum sp. SYP-B3756]
MDYGSLQDLFGEPVTTSATGKPQRASEVPAAMTIVTADEITKSGARTIPDVLNRVAGIDVLQWTSSNADVGIRGYNQGYNPRLLVLVNGRQVYQDFYGMTLWSSIPVQLSEIRQIEVVKGPQSALFGFNAVSGVINIVTYSPFYDDVGTVEATLGNLGQKEFSFVKTLKLGTRGGIRLSAGGWDMDTYGTNTSTNWAKFYDKKSSSRTASLDSLFQITPDIQAGLETTWNSINEFGIASSGEYVRNDYKTYSIRGNLKANTRIGLLEANAYSNNLDVNLGSRVSFVNTKMRSNIVQLQDLVKLDDRLTTRIGLEFRDISMKSYPVRGATNGYKNYALSNMFDWQATTDLSLTLALRGDHTALYRDGPRPYPFTDTDYERSFNSFSYNAGMVWRVTANDSLLLTTARGISSPSLIELRNNSVTAPSPNSLLISGNPNVDPSVTTSYEIGWRHMIDDINGFGRLSVSHQKTTDLKFVNLSSPKLINGYRVFLLGDNLGSTQAWTLEAELQGKLDAFRWNLSWMWMDTEDAIKISNLLIGENYEKSNARNTVKANIGWDSGPWSTDLLLLWKSKTYRYLQDGSNKTLFEVNPGLMTQASVGYQVTSDLRISLSGANLLKDETRLTPAPKAERRVWATVSYKL